MEHGFQIVGPQLTLAVPPGTPVWVRKSSMMALAGDYTLKVDRITRRRLALAAVFSAFPMKANRWTAGDNGMEITAGLGFHGVVGRIEVTGEEQLYIRPGLYLAHTGDLSFHVERASTRNALSEFFYMTRVDGIGTVYIKVCGQPTHRVIPDAPFIADINYVAAIWGDFVADGSALGIGNWLRSGEADNVALSGSGRLLFQSQNEQTTFGGGGGGFVAGIVEAIIPF